MSRLVMFANLNKLMSYSAVPHPSFERHSMPEPSIYSSTPPTEDCCTRHVVTLCTTDSCSLITFLQCAFGAITQKHIALLVTLGVVPFAVAVLFVKSDVRAHHSFAARGRIQAG
eukprot:6176225-Pleurochrysis_carterae.AAC.7